MINFVFLKYESLRIYIMILDFGDKKCEDLAIMNMWRSSYNFKVFNFQFQKIYIAIMILVFASWERSILGGFCKLIEVGVRWRLSIAGTCHCCHFYFTAGTHFYRFFCCRSITYRRSSSVSFLQMNFFCNSKKLLMQELLP